MPVRVEELEQARSILQAVKNCEKTSEQASSLLHVSCTQAAIDDFACFLEALSRLRQLAAKMHLQKGRSAVAEVELGMGVPTPRGERGVARTARYFWLKTELSLDRSQISLHKY